MDESNGVAPHGEGDVGDALVLRGQEGVLSGVTLS